MELNAETVRKVLDWLDSLVGNSNNSDMAVFTYQLLGILYDTCEEKEQKIFELENRLKECENGYEGTLALERAKLKKLTKENESLKAENEQWRSDWSENQKQWEIAYDTQECAVRADTVREMQERIKTRCIKSGIYPAIVARAIDQVAKEMTEEEQ